jgi:hypothetical protein
MAWDGTNTVGITKAYLIGDDVSDVAVDFPAPPLLLSPPDKAAGIDRSTVFQWTPYDGTIYRFNFFQGNSGYLIWLYTASTSLTLPDLSAVGVAYAPNVDNNWSGTAVGPAKTVDDYVATGDALRSTGMHIEAWKGMRRCSLSP